MSSDAVAFSPGEPTGRFKASSTHAKISKRSALSVGDKRTSIPLDDSSLRDLSVARDCSVDAEANGLNELIEKVKLRAVYLVACQAFEGSVDFEGKLIRLRSFALDPSTMLRADPEFIERVDVNGKNGAESKNRNGIALQRNNGCSWFEASITNGGSGLLRSANANGKGVPDKLTVGSLCSEFDVTRQRLIRIFRRQGSASPGRWLASLRFQAAAMMRQEGWAFKTIATRLGYSHRSSIWRLITANRHSNGSNGRAGAKRRT